MEQPSHETDASVRSILPALKTFPTNEVAIIGCHALNLSRRSCEYDLLVVNSDPIPEKLIKVGDLYAKIIFRNEREVRQPDLELALTLASAVPLRDSSLLLAGAASDCKRSFICELQEGGGDLPRVLPQVSCQGRRAPRPEKETQGGRLLASLRGARLRVRRPPDERDGPVPEPRPGPDQDPSQEEAFELQGMGGRLRPRAGVEGLLREQDWRVSRSSTTCSGPAESGRRRHPSFGRYRDVEAVRVMEMKAHGAPGLHAVGGVLTLISARRPSGVSSTSISCTSPSSLRRRTTRE